MFQVDYLMIAFISFFLLYVLLAFRSVRKTTMKVDLSLRHQTEANHLLKKLIDETRLTNQYLARLAGIELEEVEAEASNEGKLYVGNIDYSASEDELESLFSQFGKIELVNIPVNRYTGKARGFGFVTFESSLDAQNALALNGTEFKGRQILVNYAKDRG